MPRVDDAYHPWKQVEKVAEIEERYAGQSKGSGAQIQTDIVRTYFSEVKEKPVEWVWANRIPRGKLVIFSGNPDVGKTTVLIDIVATVTTGRTFPDGEANQLPPSEVLMLIAEDDLADTVKPRLIAAGADLNRVSYVRAVRLSDKAKKHDRLLALDTDIGLLENELRKNPQIKLVVLDPITGYVGRADMNREQELRRVLGPIKEMCESLGVTVIGLGHFNKRSDVSALHKVGGAVAMSGVARAVWLFMRNPEIPGEYLMLLGKGNLTKKRTGLRYRFLEKILPTGGVPTVEWNGEIGGDADSVLAMATDPNERRGIKAARFLSEFLASGPRPSDEVFAAGEEKRIFRNALFEAKSSLGVSAVRTGGRWYWELSKRCDDSATGGEKSRLFCKDEG